MKFLLLPLGGFLAHTCRLLALGTALREKGHTVVFAGPKAYSEHISSQKFEYIPLLDLNPDFVLSRLKEANLYFHNIKSLSDLTALELEVYDRVQPDAVICDSRFSVKVSSRIAGIPLISIASASWTPFSALHVSLPESHPYVRFLKRRLRGELPSFAEVCLRAIYSDVMIRPYNYYLRRHGRKRFEKFEELFLGDLTLLSDIPEFSPCVRLPSHVHFTGPLLWSEDGVPADAGKDTEREKPLIYVSMGSSGDTEVFLKILSYLNALPEFEVIATTGGKMVSHFTRIRSFDWLSAGAALPEAKLVIFHGGSGTLYQALSFGIPVLGIPFHFEQEWNCRRIQELGLGLWLKPEEMTCDTFLSTVRKILQTQTFYDRAEWFSKKIKGQSAKDLATKLVDEFFLLSSRRQHLKGKQEKKEVSRETELPSELIK